MSSPDNITVTHENTVVQVVQTPPVNLTVTSLPPVNVEIATSGLQGAIGPTPNLQPGVITTGAAGTGVLATITGTLVNPLLNLTIPRGDTGAVGPAPTLNTPTATALAVGATPTVGITGTNPYTINFGIPVSAVWTSGTGAPATGSGNVGDYYLVSSGTGVGDIYKKTAVATWTPQGNIRGAAGTGNVTSSGALVVGNIASWNSTGGLIQDAGIATTDILRLSTAQTISGAKTFSAPLVLGDNLTINTATPSHLWFRKGDATTVVTMLGIGLDVGKSLGLIVGTVGAGFLFDQTGTFSIAKDTKANLDAGTTAGGTAIITVTGSTSAVVLAGTLTANGLVSLGATTASPPTFSSRSAGAKLALYDSVSATEAGYNIGIESNGMWFGVGNATGTQFRWYGGTTVAATLTGSGNLSTVGTITAAGTGFAGPGVNITTLNGSNITTGTVPDARLSANVVLTSGAQTIAGVKTFSSQLVSSNGFYFNDGWAPAIRYVNNRVYLGYSGNTFDGIDFVTASSTIFSVEKIGFSFVPNTVTIGANVPTMRSTLVSAPAYSGAFTVTTAATLAISSAPIAAGGATITNSYSLWTQSGTARIDTGAAATTGLIVRGFTSQSGNLQEWQTSTGTVMASVSPTGLITANAGVSIPGGQILNLGAANVGLPSKTTRSAGTKIVLYGLVDASNTDYAMGINTSTLWFSAGQPSGKFEWYVVDQKVATLDSVGNMTATSFIGSGASLTALNGSNISTGTIADARLTTNVALLNAAQTYTGAAQYRAAITQYTTYTGSNSLTIMPVGATAQTNTQVYFEAYSSTTRGLTIRGAASQTANLQEWQDSTTAVLASITSAGVFTGSGAGLTSLTAANISGVIPIANIPTGTSGTTVALGNHGHALTDANVTGVLVLAKGGTGNAFGALPPGAVITAASTTAFGVTAAGTAGQYLRSAGAGTPTWAAPTPAEVGLGNVANLAQVDLVNAQTIAGIKTFSSAPVVPAGSWVISSTTGLQSALDLKAPLASPTFTGTVAGITATMVGLGNVANLAQVDLVNAQTISGIKTFSSAPVVPDGSWVIAKTTGLQSALDLKAPLASPTFTGTVSGITATMVGLGLINNVAQVEIAGAQTITGAKTFSAPIIATTVTGVFFEKSAAASGTSGTVTLDASANAIYTLTPTAAVTTLTLSNPPAAGTVVTVQLKVSQGATPYAIATPTGGIFYGTATPTQVANKKCIFTYVTTDGGTTWDCSAAVQV